MPAIFFFLFKKVIDSFMAIRYIQVLSLASPLNPSSPFHTLMKTSWVTSLASSWSTTILRT